MSQGGKSGCMCKYKLEGEDGDGGYFSKGLWFVRSDFIGDISCSDDEDGRVRQAICRAQVVCSVDTVLK